MQAYGGGRSYRTFGRNGRSGRRVVLERRRSGAARALAREDIRTELAAHEQECELQARAEAYALALHLAWEAARREQEREDEDRKIKLICTCKCGCFKLYAAA